MPTAATLSSEEAPHRASLESVTVARNLQCKSDCHSAQESICALCIPSFTGTGDYFYCNFDVPGLKSVPFAGQLVKWVAF